MKAIISSFFAAFLLFSVSGNSQSGITNYQPLYKVVESKDKEARSIYIKDLRTNQTHLFRQIDDVPMYGFQNFAEYYSDNLYVLVRRNEESQHWQDELWHYTKTSKRLLASGRGLAFSVQPQQLFTAYTTGPDLTIYSLANQKIKKRLQLIKDPESPEQVQLVKWSLEKNQVWGYVSEVDEIRFFFSYDIDKDKLATFATTNAALEHDINPDRGLLLYSDYPTFFEEGGEKEFLKKNLNINLYVYNFQTKKTTKLATQKKKDFTAKWLTPDTFEYYDAVQKKRIQKKI